jgi:SAM-dependent methyltransferase
MPDAFDEPGAPAPHEHNRRAWDARARARQCFAEPARDDDLADPLAKIDGCGWLDGQVRGRRVLCLASGGGRQSAIFAAAGAIVTVVDISGEMLSLDRQVAAERRLDVRTVQASMDDLSALAAASFDVVAQPVSTCYVPDVLAVYRQVARVLVPGGLYVSQHKQPVSLQADVKPSPRGYELVEPYYRTQSMGNGDAGNAPLPPVAGSRHREPGTLEYLHRWEDLLGGLCRAGFVIEDVIEPLFAEPDAAVGTFNHRGQYVPPYVRIKARRVATQSTDRRSALWTP